ncbi:MAG: serine--tRNA ligase [Candidatus Komeilibacteria bacterium CG_4_10_14_0_2_um_filter_37_10]|uniref:Serine--tRNA ligase n=1 Tax=Candidatus Komeilibacteria bacterium CG_4_10_14_0_2_um_filter_37_10 TaxID=1974470 RepID=A0A2M7VDU8_9BACT|nr:MAG: serine--tRNA ligase [Candidatus Komeilibacteria bacterium CG_4_10_14_0_2_um_filter_37_10]
MLDINLIRQNIQNIQNNLARRDSSRDFHLVDICSLDDQRRSLIQQVDDFKKQQNILAKGGKPTAEQVTEGKELRDQVTRIAVTLKDTEQKLDLLMSELPNLIADDVVAGGKENNIIVKTNLKLTKFSFTPKDHVALATELGLIDYARAVKIAGSGFWAYVGQGAVLEWALLNYFIDFHRQNNYCFVIPPFLLTEKSAYTSGHLPKFRDDLFWTEDKLCLNATSEMMLGNFHRDEILDEQKLPLKYFAYSPCFRREAGSYRAEERGMIRGHQFNKIEMFQLTKPEDSWSAFDELVTNAEKLLIGLGLHFNTVKLAAGDCSSAMAKTYDLEVYLPSMQGYKEVSSISNALDYQARRGHIRFKRHGKSEYVHTLNASGLATSRLLPAILEQYQQANGSVIVPEVLQKYCGFSIIE